MQTVTVPLIRSYEHEGRYVAAGESITVTPLEALALARRGVVSLTRGYQHRALSAAPYRPAIEAEIVVTEPTIEAQKTRRRRKVTELPPTDKPKRRYRRRDLTAEV